MVLLECKTAVNQIYVIHEAMNSCKKSKDLLKASYENVNIKIYILLVTNCVMIP